MTLKFDPAAVTDLIRRTAAECIVPRYRRLAAHEVRKKGPGDVVTAADIAAEEMLSRLLVEHMPGSVVVGEEAATHDRSIFDRLAGEAPVWVVDPLDGTFNFANARPPFATIVALIVHGGVRAGWIHDPLSGESVIAAAGGGAYLDGRRLLAGNAPALAGMVGALSGRIEGRGRARDIARTSGRFGPQIDHSCAGRTYIDLAQSRIHFALYRRTLPWDHAAGWLIHREIGGYGAFLDGEPYSPVRLDGPILLAPSEAAWRDIRAILLAPPAASQAGS
ncbi:MAG: inositol monophosphatase [Rhodospirillales bacterium]|nr:inositol monophosphatase [Rhodospirillales bacterium]